MEKKEDDQNLQLNDKKEILKNSFEKIISYSKKILNWIEK